MAHENATPRPWSFSHGLRRILGALDDDYCHPQIAEGISKRVSNSDPRAVQFERDAALIVEAVNAYETLRSENERLADRNSHLESFLNGVMQLGEGNPKTVDLLVGLTRLCKEAQLLMVGQAR